MGSFSFDMLEESRPKKSSKNWSIKMVNFLSLFRFARDFKKLAESDFPAQQMASELGRQQKCQLMGRDTIRARLEKLEGALRLTEEFLAVLEQDRSPIMDTVGKSEKWILKI